jgi:hypothetical protein
MAQEVQTTLDYRAELNLIEWVWYQERKVSDKTQIRDKWGSSWDWTSDTMYIDNWSWISPTSRTVNQELGWVRYRVSWWYVIIPTAWLYLAQITPYQWSSSYEYTIKILVNGEERFSKRLAYKQTYIIHAMLNLGKKDKVTLAAKAQSVTATTSLWLKLIQL